MPSSPGTEQTSLAFRNVLHLLTRQQWPPSSFWWGWAGAESDQLAHPQDPAKAGLTSQDWAWAGGSKGASYQADPPNAGVHGRALRRLYGPLTEEEVELVVVALGTVRDELGVDERRVCRRAGVSRQGPPQTRFPAQARCRNTPNPSLNLDKKPPLP